MSIVLESFGQALVRIRLKLGYKTTKSFYNYLISRGLVCNYQHYVKIEKNSTAPSNSLVSQITKSLDRELATSLVLNYCSNIFPGFSYLFNDRETTELVNEKEKDTWKISSSKELSALQVATLAKRKENYYLFLILTLSRMPFAVTELKTMRYFNKALKDLQSSKLIILENEKIRARDTEYRFPKEQTLQETYALFDSWDVEFATDFNFQTYLNKMMTRRISPRYLGVINKHIEALTDLIRLSDESDKSYNTEVLHIHIKLQKGELPG